MTVFVALPNLAVALASSPRDLDDLAVEIGVSVDVLSALVRGTTIADEELEAQVAAVLDAPVEHLFERHPTIRRLNAGRRLEDREVGERLARLARDSGTVTRTS